MDEGLIFLICLISITVELVIAYFAARKFEEIAEMKGHSGYFAWCFWLGIIGWCMVIALPDRSNKTAEKAVDESLPEL